MKSTRWVITYIVMASVGLWVAFFMSLKFMTSGRAQGAEGQPPPKMEAPAPGDLPPEFVQETQTIPPPPSQPPVETQAADAAATPPMVPADVPPGAPPTIPVGEVSAESPEQMGVVVEPQFASDDQYTYDPTGRRDPFKPYKSFQATPAPVAGSTTKIVDPTDPLQRWDLDRFSVVAILWEVRYPKAMVKDPDGKTYMIAKSTLIGRNNGHVVAIREGEVVVVENIENEGVQTKEVKILELKK